MSSSLFPLLQLPSLALMEIIQQIELKEQFKLSLCSKRMRFAVKNYRYKSTVSLKLSNVEDDIEIRLLNEKCSEDQVTFKIRSLPELYPSGWETYKTVENMSFWKDTELFVSCWKNVVQETKTLVEHLCDLFTAKVKKVEISNYNIWMLDIVEERQGGYSYDAEVSNSYGYGSNEKLRHTLLDLNPRSLYFFQKTFDECRIENFHKKYEDLTISAEWMKGKHLCQLDCVKLRIFDRQFFNTEINQYLRHVLSGGAPRLKEFRAEICNANENVMLDGIQELLTESERFVGLFGDWEWNGKLAREKGLVLVSIKYLGFGHVYLDIKDA